MTETVYVREHHNLSAGLLLVPKSSKVLSPAEATFQAPGGTAGGEVQSQGPHSVSEEAQSRSLRKYATAPLWSLHYTTRHCKDDTTIGMGASFDFHRATVRLFLLGCLCPRPMGCRCTNTSSLGDEAEHGDEEGEGHGKVRGHEDRPEERGAGRAGLPGAGSKGDQRQTRQGSQGLGPAPGSGPEEHQHYPKSTGAGWGGKGDSGEGVLVHVWSHA